MGIKAQKMGKGFEECFKTACLRQGLVCLKLPLGARIYGSDKHGKPKYTLVKAPFDFVIAGVLKGLSVACYLDTKTIDSKEFQKSLIDWKQIDNLLPFADVGHPAGYLIYFREIQMLVFICAKKIVEVGNQRNLLPQDGVEIGSLFDLDIRKIWSNL